MTARQPSGGSTLERALSALEKMERKLAATERAQVEPLAIVGMACRLPGGVANPTDVWQMLHAGTNAVGEVPVHRWNQGSGVQHPAARWAGLLNDIDQFDAPFFGLARNEAVDMDPQHRFLLEVAWEALEDAGIPPDRLSGTKTGVFVGIASHDYANLIMSSGSSARPYVSTGNAGSFAAGRIAYLLGVQGPCMSIDTACSSSLVAFHLACQSLRRGECDMALVGGVNLLLAPEVSAVLASLQILSPDGRCRTFDARANGYVRAEAAGMFVLRRYSDAQRSGDRVLALVRGSAMNQNGRPTSLTAPNLHAQTAVLREALANARVKPEQVGYVEVHSNGSPFGDPVELEALREVLGNPRTDGSTCVLGSIKTFIGHAEAASSIASLVKTVLVLNHETIPRNLHFESLNPNASLEDSPFVIPTQELTWKRNAARRLAGVSATGLSGTNAHVILEEPPVVPRATDKPERPLHVFVLSGKTGPALRARAKQMLRHFGAHPELSLGDQCHTLALGRSHFEHRFAAIVESSADVIAQLTDFLDGASSGYVVKRVENLSARRRIAAMLTGGAAQAVGILGAVHAAPPVFVEALRRGDLAAHAMIGRHVSPLLDTDTRSTLPDDAIDEDLALFVLQAALVELWRSWGIEPAVFVGEGTGECVAAWATGALEFDDALALAAARARFVKSNGRDTQELDKVLARLSLAAPKKAFLASMGSAHTLSSLAQTGYWQAQRTAAFDAVPFISQFSSQGFAACLEIGPRAIVAANSPVSADVFPIFPSLRPRVPPYRTLLETLASLHVIGFDIHWENFDAPHPYRRMSLPTYPFQRERYWFGNAPAIAAEPTATDGHPLLGKLLEPRADRPDIRVWEMVLGNAHYLTIGVQYLLGTSVLSSGGMVQIACAAAHDFFPDKPVELQLLLSDPPTLQDDVPTTMQVIVTPDGDNRATMGIFFRGRPGAPWKPAARGILQPPQIVDDEEAAPPSMRPGRRQAVAQASWERRLETFGVDTDAFRIEQLWRRDGETVASVVVGRGYAVMSFARAAVAIASITHPALHGRWWMIESVEGLTTTPKSGDGRAWLRLTWNDNNGSLAHISVELIDDDGVVSATARNIALRAQDPSIILRNAGKDPLDGAFVDMVWKESPLASLPVVNKRKWIVLTDSNGVGISLAVYLQSSGDTVITLPAAALDQRLEMLDMVLRVSGPFYGVVHLGALDAPTDEWRSMAGIEEGFRRSVLTAQLVIERLVSQSYVPRLWLVTRGAQPVGETIQSAASAGLWGFGRVLSQERADMWGGMIDLDPHAHAVDATQLGQALIEMGGEDHIALRRGKFCVGRLARLPIAEQTTFEVRPDKTYLVTGPQTPLGAAVAHWLADHGARFLLLMHRDAHLPAGHAASMHSSARDLANALRGRGIDVIESTVDVSNVDTLQEFLTQSKVQLAGVFHTEGLAEESIRRLTGVDATVALQQALVAKSRAFWALHWVTADVPLDFFVNFVSIPAWLGWEGLGADATFAEFGDAVMRNRHQAGMAGTTIRLAFANESKLGSKSLDHEMLAAGFQGIPVELSLRAMERGIASGQPTVAVTWADWDLFEHAHRERANRSLFAGITEGRRVRTGAAALQRRIVGAEPEQARRTVEAIVRGEVVRVLGGSAIDVISNQQELGAFGMDSIMAVQVLTSIGAIFGVTMPASTLLQHPSIEALSSRIIHALRRSSASEHAIGPISRTGAITELNAGTSKFPFFFAPPITGSGLIFQPLVEHMSKARPFFTFNAPGVDSDIPPCDRVEALASRFLEALRQVQPKGPYRIGGYSFGSLVAYEMAQRLTRAGEYVDALVMGDLPPPRLNREDPSPFIQLARIVGLPVDELGLNGLNSEEQAATMATATGELLDLPSEVAESAKQIRIYRAHLNAIHEYCPAPYGGPVTLIRTQGTIQRLAQAAYHRNDPTFGWARLCQQSVRVHDIGGHHMSALSVPTVLELARTLDKILEAAEAR